MAKCIYVCYKSRFEWEWKGNVLTDRFTDTCFWFFLIGEGWSPTNSFNLAKCNSFNLAKCNSFNFAKCNSFNLAKCNSFHLAKCNSFNFAKCNSFKLAKCNSFNLAKCLCPKQGRGYSTPYIVVFLY